MGSIICLSVFTLPDGVERGTARDPRAIFLAVFLSSQSDGFGCRSPRAGGGDGDDEMGDDGEYDDDAALDGDGMGDEEGWWVFFGDI